jgi:hypothetical protein
MEKPRMDADLHLLRLMYQQLEEARALGNPELLLEYREEPSLLRVWVAGMDAVEEVGYGGLEREGELVEEPSGKLRRLSSEDYIELHPGASDASSGTVTITGRGLEKIKYRRAFESNLPRSLKRWEVSLLGLREIKHTRLWKASWEGREITVRNRRSFLGKRCERFTEYLNVNHSFPPAYRVEKSRFAKDLYGELRARDGVYELYAHIGLTTPLLQTGCLISVDGVVIGGDVDKRFLT